MPARKKRDQGLFDNVRLTEDDGLDRTPRDGDPFQRGLGGTHRGGFDRGRNCFRHGWPLGLWPNRTAASHPTIPHGMINACTVCEANDQNFSMCAWQWGKDYGQRVLLPDAESSPPPAWAARRRISKTWPRRWAPWAPA